VEESEGALSSRASRRRVLRFVAACVAMICAGAVLLVVQKAPASKAAHFEHAFADDYVGTVWFTLSVDSAKPRQVTVRWERLRRSFEHRNGSPVTYAIEKGVGKERSEPLFVDVSGAADVTFSFGKAPDGAVDLSAQPWEALPYNSGVAAPRPANADSATAQAAVDESVSYGGVDIAGIGLRSRPELAGDRLGAVKHGEVYPATCWVRGQTLTNGNLSDPADDNASYSSDVWWRIATPVTTGYISDVWFSRRGTSDRLNLPECAPGSS
jgi:hypothetical protein